MSNLRIGVPSKGRLSEIAAELLKQAGLSFRRQERSLFARVGEMPVDITFLRTDDIPVLCAEGAIDMGITGSDLVAEAEADVITRLPLGIGKCKLALCVPDDSTIDSPSKLDGKSLRLLLKNPDAPWPRPAITQVARQLERPVTNGIPEPTRVNLMGYSIRTERWRYTEWNGDEKGVELYDHNSDPDELMNLANDPAFSATTSEIRKRLRRAAPEAAKQ